MSADGRRGPALDAHGPGRLVGSERHEGLGPPGADKENTIAPKEGGVVEGARVPEAARAGQPEIGRHPLAFAHDRRLAVECHLKPPRRRSAVVPVEKRVHVEDQSRTVRSPPHRLLGEAPFDVDDGRERHAGDVIGGQRASGAAERSQHDRERREGGRRCAITPKGQRARAQGEEEASCGQNPGGSRRRPRPREDAERERGREREKRRLLPPHVIRRP